jgi:diguanylate cyclase (GGDEF)-like protein
MRIHLPHGRGLPADDFERRHRALVAVLVLATAALGVAAAATGAPVAHVAADVGPLAVLAAAARWAPAGRRGRAALCAGGLLGAAVVLVHLAHGVTEAHFAFFVVVTALALYEDWIPFLLAIAVVVVHHLVLGHVDPEAVFGEGREALSPLGWTLVHTAFISAAGLASIVVWAANEGLRSEKDALIARLETLSHEDQLTGLPNRRAWDAAAGAALDAAARSGRPLTIAMLDLDGLKLVNDHLGHQAGDLLLRSAAAAWATVLRRTDVLCRLGGDEFAVLMPECDATDGEGAAERLLEATPRPHSVSIGIACWDGAEPLHALVRRADHALLEAKDRGRARHRVAP